MTDIPTYLFDHAVQRLDAAWEQLVPDGSLRVPLYEHPRPDGFNAACCHTGRGISIVRLRPKLFRYLVEEPHRSDWLVEYTVYVGACDSCGKHLHAMEDEPTVTQLGAGDVAVPVVV